jgi:NAD+--dinitrogen-reductase ADP-D-ribosyltransferase
MQADDPDTTIATRGHSTNLVGLPTGLLASASYNDFPVPLCIAGTREAHRSLFERLNGLSDANEAGRIFQDYTALVFGLDHVPEKNERRRYRASYLRLLKDWGFDSNSPAGAVLKGWVESRFGLFPTFHKAPIRRFNSPAWTHYTEEKMSFRFNNNAIQMQLDLLYEFCQWMLVRFHSTGKKHLQLYRGTNDLREQQLIQQIDARNAIVRLNSLVSFTSQRGIADEFGDTIIQAEVPVMKLLFFNHLLSENPLRGEEEYLVIGGDYRVKMSYW